jgi:D-serine deaminase-like pyridoxal phosphate-dependent protein
MIVSGSPSRCSGWRRGRSGLLGAEYGLLKWKETERDIELGELVEIYPSNLDTSTNVYDRYYVAKGDDIVDVWPIMGRSGVAQR